MRFNRKSINAKLWIYFSLFTAVILIFLWLMQIVFIGNYYQHIKKRDVSKVAASIEKQIDSADLASVISDLAYQYDLSVGILNMQGEMIISDEGSRLRIFQRLPQFMLKRLISDVENTRDKVLFRSLNENTVMNTPGQRLVLPPNERPGSGGTSGILLLSKVVGRADGSKAVMLVSSSIVPIHSTINILKEQLIYIAIILLLLSVILAFTISHNISKPIIKMNQTAKNLAAGNYQIEFEKGGYDEIDQLSKTLTTAAKELSRVEELRRELIANVSHDLRTPLTMIKAYAELIRDLPEDREKVDHLQVIIDESDRLSYLVSDIMKISQLQAGVESLNRENYHITQGIKNILDRYKVLNQKNGYTFEFSYEEEVTVPADRIKVEQVLYNLINNAINYSTEQKHILIKQTASEHELKIEVTDQGEGIPEDKLPYIWDRYYKVDKVHKRAIIGTGLGLCIVKNVLEMHGAKYGVKSQIGKGSTFWFVLPIQAKSLPS